MLQYVSFAFIIYDGSATAELSDPSPAKYGSAHSKYDTWNLNGDFRKSYKRTFQYYMQALCSQRLSF